MTKRRAEDVNRVTVTLAEGQREALDKIAKENGTTLAFVVRYAIKHYIQASAARPVMLDIPPDKEDGDGKCKSQG